MDFQEDHYSQAINLINNANAILLVSHRRPDADTLGCAAAMHLGLKSIGKCTTLACIDEIPQRLQFIPETDKFVKEFNLSDFDLIIALDSGAHHMTGFNEIYPEFLSKIIPIINIDHHASNEGFGTVNIVDAKSSSTTMIIWKLFNKMSLQITPDIAFALMVGIYGDTGAFMHSNTTQEAFEIAAQLAKTDINIPEITKALFKNSTFSQLRLWGYILENLQKNDKKVLTSVLTENDFKTINAHVSDTGGIIDLINTVPDTAFSLLVAEDEGLVKGSLRTQSDNVNVSDIAGQFGGGGHRKAAGFRLHGRLEKQTVWKIVPIE